MSYECDSCQQPRLPPDASLVARLAAPPAEVGRMEGRALLHCEGKTSC